MGQLEERRRKITLEEYYEHYLSLHQHPLTKVFHILGNVLTVFYFFAMLILSLRDPVFFLGFLFTPFVVYPFAWFSHLFIEKNKPAAWSKPFVAKLCDWMMILDLVTGELKLDSRKKDA